MTTTNWITGQTLYASALDQAFGRCIDRAGDIMQGPFTLFQDPANPLDAVTKEYVDNRFATYQPFGVSAFNSRTGSVNLVAADVSGVGGALITGFTMTGTITLAANPVAPLQPVTLQYFTSNTPLASSTLPVMDGTAAVGASATWARADHVHPSDVSKLSVTGGTMGGPIVLNADPTTNLQAATKQYVDTAIAAKGQFLGVWHVAANSPNITPPYPGIANGSYFICTTASAGVGETPPGGIPISPAVPLIYSGDTLIWNASGNTYNYVPGSSLTKSQADTYYVNKPGDTMTGFLTLNADPTANLHAATKQYVDAHSFSLGTAPPLMDGVATPGTSPLPSHQDHVHPHDATLLPLTGGTLTGPLTLSADPAAALQPATKQYVDANTGAVTVADTAPTGMRSGSLWWSSATGQLYINYQDPNSTEWVIANNGGGGIGEAPNDGQIYGRNGQAQGWQPAATPSMVAANVGRNVLHNSLFNIAQRGAGGWTTFGVYTLDRWKTGGSTDTINWQQAPINDTERAAIGDEAAQNALQNVFTGNAAAGAYNEILQAVEKVSRLSGKTVIVSFWAVASLPLKIGINAAQSFGTGGSPSGAVNTLPTGLVANVTSTWTRFSGIISFPSIAGKTLGTNGDDCTNIRFGLSSGANANQYFGNIGVQSGTVKLWGVQLEVVQPGQTQPTALEHPDPQQDLAKCMRFFHGNVFLYLAGYGTAGVGIATGVNFPVPMRAPPTINYLANNCVNFSGGSPLTYTSATAVWPSGSVATTGGFVINLSVSASADL